MFHIDKQELHYFNISVLEASLLKLKGCSYSFTRKM